MPSPGADPSAHDHDHCVAEALTAAVDLCARRGERLTPLRRRVLELVWRSHAPVGAYALLDALRQEGLGAAPPTVYRALDFLLAQGLIHRLESMNAFVGCIDPHHPHQVQLLICRGCGAVQELTDPRVGAAVGAAAADVGFTIERQTIEIAGLCRHCAGS